MISDINPYFKSAVSEMQFCHTIQRNPFFFGGGGGFMWLSINSGRDYKMYSLTCNKSKSIPQGYAHVCQGWSSTKVVDLLMY